jgi:F-type H+-transporting ATPase subunit epsilon
MAEFQIEIVTPERLVVRDVAHEAQIPGKDGYLGILPGHAPLVTELGVGEINYRVDGFVHRLAVAWGFAEVLPTKVTILAETAERAEDIDVARAQKARDAAQRQLQSGDPNTNYDLVQAALERAETRLQVAAGR